ncbi:MAG: SsrA-binding protein SmpB [Verrucomicrobiota bacterium]|jgi:SsrA-binding protein|nr:SsrA-binding protein SmpB [Verrucomicrobiota bacterium]MDD8049753.1 SsrA-binding protein SmpB [Verrucomicrobiota bacterium]
MSKKGSTGQLQAGVLCKNRKARHEYEVVDTLEAGVQLVGTEVKSLRNGGGNIRDAFARVEHGEVFLYGLHIAPYSHGNQFNHVSDRSRRLLLHKREILRLAGLTAQKGLTLIPLSLYLKNGRVKVELGVCRGKAKADKRQDLRERDADMEVKRAMSRRVERDL